MTQGFIKIHRCVTESDIYRMPPLYLRVFERLLLEANHKDKAIRYKPKGKNDFEEKTIKRGEKLTSLRAVAEWVGWYENGLFKVPNVKTIKVILDWLISQDMIHIFNRGNSQETHYKVLKYDVYQGCDSDESNDLETAWKQPSDTNNNDIRMLKNEKEIINNPPGSDQEVFTYWNQQKIVVHSKVTNSIRISIQLAVKLYPLENIKTAIDHYATMYNDSTYEYCNYKWTLEKFIDDPKGITYFMDDGQKWLSYLNRKGGQPNGQENDDDLII